MRNNDELNFLIMFSMNPELIYLKRVNVGDVSKEKKLSFVMDLLCLKPINPFFCIFAMNASVF